MTTDATQPTPREALPPYPLNAFQNLGDVAALLHKIFDLRDEEVRKARTENARLRQRADEARGQHDALLHDANARCDDLNQRARDMEQQLDAAEGRYRQLAGEVRDVVYRVSDYRLRTQLLAALAATAPTDTPTSTVDIDSRRPDKPETVAAYQKAGSEAQEGTEPVRCGAETDSPNDLVAKLVCVLDPHSVMVKHCAEYLTPTGMHFIEWFDPEGVEPQGVSAAPYVRALGELRIALLRHGVDTTVDTDRVAAVAIETLAELRADLERVTQERDEAQAELDDLRAVPPAELQTRIEQELRAERDALQATLDDLRAKVGGIAWKIRGELVCCDIYERDRGTERAGKTHAICFWGEAAARIAEDCLRPRDSVPTQTDTGGES